MVLMRPDPTDVPEDMRGALSVVTPHVVPALARGESRVLRAGHGLSEGHEEPSGEEGRVRLLADNGITTLHLQG